MVDEMTPEPADGLPGVPTAQMHHQVDRAASTMASVPVEEFRAGDRKRATRGTPLGLISPVTLRPPRSQDDFQRDRANQVGSPPEVVSEHGIFLTLWTPR
jgi:hypothetical protein